MSDINDDEVPCCSKDVKREDERLLQKFVPMHVFSNATVMKMKGQWSSSRRVKTHKCSQCDYQTKWRKDIVCSTTQKGCLVTQQRSHTGDKPYSCTLCDCRPSQMDGVTQHMLTHTGDKPFACSECDYRSARKAHLADHMRTHSNEKPFACSECGYKTARKKHFTRHKRIHSNEKPFACL